MWTHYTKTYCFRDCFDKSIVDGNIRAINNLLHMKQKDGNIGSSIGTDVIGVGGIADTITAYQSEDDGTWYIEFQEEEREIAIVSLWDYKEIQLCFDIEENLETGVFIIHYCKIKGFKEYQI